MNDKKAVVIKGKNNLDKLLKKQPKRSDSIIPIVGDQYKRTKHNAGFWAIDKFAERKKLIFNPLVVIKFIKILYNQIFINFKLLTFCINF